MALTLIETAAASNANTYVTLAEAETIMETVFHKDAWTAATDANKKIVLVEATRLLDAHYEWNGIKYTDAQSLRWPRYSVYDPDGDDLDYDSIPSFLKTATALLALSILSEDVTAEPDTAGFKELKVGPLELVVDKIDRSRVIPDTVHQLVKFYGRNIQRSATVPVYRT